MIVESNCLEDVIDFVILSQKFLPLGIGFLEADDVGVTFNYRFCNLCGILAPIAVADVVDIESCNGEAFHFVVVIENDTITNVGTEYKFRMLRISCWKVSNVAHTMLWELGMIFSNVAHRDGKVS